LNVKLFVIAIPVGAKQSLKQIAFPTGLEPEFFNRNELYFEVSVQTLINSRITP